MYLWFETPISHFSIFASLLIIFDWNQKNLGFIRPRSTLSMAYLWVSARVETVGPESVRSRRQRYSVRRSAFDPRTSGRRGSRKMPPWRCSATMSRPPRPPLLLTLVLERKELTNAYISYRPGCRLKRPPMCDAEAPTPRTVAVAAAAEVLLTSEEATTYMRYLLRQKIHALLVPPLLFKGKQYLCASTLLS